MFARQLCRYFPELFRHCGVRLVGALGSGAAVLEVLACDLREARMSSDIAHRGGTFRCGLELVRTIVLFKMTSNVRVHRTRREAIRRSASAVQPFRQFQ